MSHSRNYFRRSLFVTLALLLIAAWGSGQSGSGNLQGQVTDTSGAAIPAITVAAIDAAGASHQAQTNEEGRYTFSQLAPGTYTLRIQLKGFADFEKKGVVVALGPDADGQCPNGGGAGEAADYGARNQRQSERPI